ncbi:MAG: dTDP-4-dehydrorhamnose 3,5-epimerase [Bdellovibrionales bacterium]|jgi:dTDP-4-dehydrorhamnose 3,5-epimerase|nr:dTDP-4-dehydrorhamnose 3,5-epimerase [Bdellovibrionales bacterium]MBT3526827.1 dTDP-4-dehydrorhamnose 3,5-epimerase [Bdellovibrionales bacterium]MBT7668207.1 dTDP-4-dehydrorhamnose 3,5-epimerase [Bdellovibrionales bacterium]MBT7765566.1 dTDP-4-dehydrorhamnose 3,5-epimerase [Bdellovibrionales bacterium]
MEFIKTEIEGLTLVKPRVFEDDRGHFFESYNQESMKEGDINCNFIQDNQSYSCYGTIRGMHLQTGEYAQSKLVRVIKGAVLDVVADVRPQSTTFGKWFSVKLTDSNYQQLFIPKGMAHGFAVLSQDAIFQYKVDNYYHQLSESGFKFDDPELNIDWLLPINERITSSKDQKLPSFSDFRNSL